MREAPEAAPAVVASLPPSAALEIRGRVRAARDTQARDLVVTSASGARLNMSTSNVKAHLTRCLALALIASVGPHDRV